MALSYVDLLELRNVEYNSLYEWCVTGYTNNEFLNYCLAMLQKYDADYSCKYIPNNICYKTLWTQIIADNLPKTILILRKGYENSENKNYHFCNIFTTDRLMYEQTKFFNLFTNTTSQILCVYMFNRI